MFSIDFLFPVAIEDEICSFYNICHSPLYTVYALALTWLVDDCSLTLDTFAPALANKFRSSSTALAWCVHILLAFFYSIVLILLLF